MGTPQKKEEVALFMRKINFKKYDVKMAGTDY